MTAEQDSRTPAAAGATALEGRCLAGGAHSRALAAELLGIEALQQRYPIRAVAWIDHALEASIQLADEAEITFRIERSQPGAAGMVETGRLRLFFRGQGLPAELAETIEARAPERLAAIDLESLADRVAADPELGAAGLPLPPSVDEGGRPGALLDTWGNPSAYADFFAGGELARAQLDSLDPGALFTFVQHSDCECLHVNPHGGGPVVWLVNYPWDDRIRHGLSTTEHQDLATAALEGMITTDLDENDVIMGNRDKFPRALQQALRVHQRTGKTLFVSNTCTPVVTGEDIESQVKRFQRDTGCPLHYLTVTPRSMVNVFHEALVDRRLRAEREAGAARPRAVNLIGFRRGPELDELRGLLDAIGVEVNCVLLPDLSFALIDALPAAALNVMLPNQLWQHLYDQLLFSSRIPAISPPAPYGPSATGDWLAAVAEALGLAPTRPPPLAERLAAARTELEPLRARAAEQRLGFVVRADETHLLTRPAATWGVPLPSLLEELGFGLEIYLQVDGPEPARRAARRVHAALAAPGRHRIQAFEDFAGMRRRIEQSRAAAFFSNHFFDWRITSAGKSPFSLQHFEMGLRGARRTAERLLGICATPFYRRLGRHLQRSPAGLRAG